MKTIIIGSYTIEESSVLFADKPAVRRYYKNDVEIALRFPKDKKPILWTTGSAPFEFSRARAYRVWKKYFPDYYDFQLPEAIQDGLDRECVSYGEFYSKKHHEWIGYEG